MGFEKLLGCRVVRGPDWSWNDQDGSEGGVGTIVSVDKFSEDKALSEKTVLVRWDRGFKYDYRVGLNGKHDLRVYSSSSAGVKFNDVICDACLLYGITGTRWKCAECYDYDLCSECYNDDEHDLDHTFIRYDFEDQRTVVGPRRFAIKIEAKGIFPGSTVKSGGDSELDLESYTGKVIEYSTFKDIPMSGVIVDWDDINIQIPHRLGYKGKVDLDLVESDSGHCYYRDHLPIASLKDSVAMMSTMERFEVGDKVITHLDVESLQSITVACNGYWIPEIEKAIGKVGTVLEIHDDLGVGVKFETMEEKLVFHPDVLSKVHDLRVHDRVKIAGSVETVKKLQVGHRGWNDKMVNVLNKEGVVIEVDKKGDANVDVKGQRWWFNPAAVILESKEEDRSNPVEPIEGKDKQVAVADVLEFIGNKIKEKSIQMGKAIEDALNDDGFKDFKSKMTSSLTSLKDIASKALPMVTVVEMPNAKGLTIISRKDAVMSQDVQTQTLHMREDTHVQKGATITEIGKTFEVEEEVKEEDQEEKRLEKDMEKKKDKKDEKKGREVEVEEEEENASSSFFSGSAPANNKEEQNGDIEAHQLVRPFGSIEDLRRIDKHVVAEQLPCYLNVNRLVLKDPPKFTKQRCRDFCQFLKDIGRKDIVKELKRTLPCGMTGPLLDAKRLQKDLDFNTRETLTRDLTVCEWKPFAERLGISKTNINFFDEREKNPVMAILNESRFDNLTIGELYNILVESGLPASADKYL